jgi:peptide/nickel transport system ATP-binding protein
VKRLLEVDALAVRSREAVLVDGVSFDVGPGEAFTLLGETGSGKTLLAKAIMGALPRDLSATGRVIVAGAASDAGDPSARRALWGRALALLPQEPWLALDPTMRVGAQVAEVHELVRRVAGATGKAESLAKSELAALGLGGQEGKYPFMLSGGMAQRVAFAASRAGGAPVLIVDEPTKGLDAEVRNSVVAELRQVQAQGGALFVITHDVGLARELGGRVGILLEGRIVEQGPAPVVLGAPAHEYSRRLLAAEPSAWPPRIPAAPGAPIVTARGIAKRLGGRALFENLDCVVGAGERVAVVGPSGSGKTTLGNVLLGLVRPDAGRVTRSPGHGAHAFQKLYQDPPAAFAPGATIGRALRDLVQRHGLAWERVENIMERLRLGVALLDRLPSQTSGGELQRFSLLRVLLLGPAFIFADEPTSRLDPLTQQETMDFLIESTSEAGTALFLVTHDDRIAANVAQRRVALATAEPEAA